MAKKWIQSAIKRPGQLHRDLGVPQGQKIPAKKLASAKHSDNPTIRRRANLAATLKKFNLGGVVEERQFGGAIEGNKPQARADRPGRS